MVGLIPQYPVSLVANTDGTNPGGHSVPRRRRRLRDAVLEGFESIHRNRLFCASTATEITSSTHHRAGHHVVWMPQHGSSGEARLVIFHDEAHGDSFPVGCRGFNCGARPTCTMSCVVSNLCAAGQDPLKGERRP